MQASTPTYDGLTAREIEILQLFQEGLSNREISDRLFLTVGTVKWYAQQIYNKLGVSSRAEAVQVADAQGLLHPPEGAELLPDIPNNLPAEVSSFVGRTREIDQICRLLREQRLVTLTGPGGTGKTRLALKVADTVLNDFPDGVFFVNLVPLTHPDAVIRTIAQVLEVREVTQRSQLESVQAVLIRLTCLLVLDNFEHVISVAPLVTQLLSAAPGLKILVTSREVLNVTGEQQVPVLPLALPDEATTTLAQLEQVEAVALFVRRAQAIRPDFTLDADNAPLVVAICQRLDGLPLAIELAAARIRLFSLTALLNRLAQPSALLAGGARDADARHRTLYDAIAWSYALLSHDEKRLFAQLSVFRGGASIEAIDSVCSQLAPLDLMNTLNSLVDKSLVQQYEGADGEIRFRLLMMMRTFAEEHLAALDDADALRTRHAQHFITLAEAAERAMLGANRRAWLQRLAEDNENLGVAIDWLLAQGECEAVIRLANRLFRHWMRHNPSEGLARIEAIFQRCPQQAAADSALNYHAARVAFNCGAMTIGPQYAERLAHLAQQSGDRLDMARALAVRSIFVAGDVTLDQMLAWFEEALAHFTAVGDTTGMGWMNSSIGVALMLRGEHDRAAEYLEIGYRIIADPWFAAGGLQNVALNNLMRGELALARGQFHEAARLQRQEGTSDGIANALVGLAGVACGEDQYAEAARLLAVVDYILDRQGVMLDFPERDFYTDYRVRCADHLNEAQLADIRHTVRRQPLGSVLNALGIR